MKVINFFAGAGAGKSTTAAGLFHVMKKLVYSVELVTEYAKDKVYDEASRVMKDQLYMLAHQNRRLERLRDKVDYAITDSPLLLSGYYGCQYGLHPEIIVPLAKALFATYENINFFIERTKKFNPTGRIGGLDNALMADIGIKDMIYHYSYITIIDDDDLLKTLSRHLGLEEQIG